MRTVNHCATLPPSAHRLHPGLHPAAMLLVVPADIHESHHLPKPDSLVEVSGRLATLRLTEHLLNPQFDQPAPQVPPIALLSPCLAAIASAPLRVRPAREPCANLEEVIVTALCPAVDAEEAKFLATAAADALRGRDAAEGDVMPVAYGALVQVVRVSGEGVGGPDTRVAVKIGANHPAATVSEPVKAAMRARWEPRYFWPVRKPLRQLDWCVENSVTLASVQGLSRDIDDLFVAFGAAAPTFHVSGQDAARRLTDAMESSRKAKLAAAVVCDARKGISTEIVDTILKVSCQEGPAVCFDVDYAGRGVLGAEPTGLECTTTVFLTCEDANDLPSDVLHRIQVEIVLAPADEGERTRILKEEINGLGASSDLKDHIREMARMSTGFAHSEIVGVASAFRHSGISACRKSVELFGKGKLSVDVGGITWGDIGGLENAKEEIVDLVDMGTESTGTASAGTSANINRRVGVLLYGPPGTGKTLLARAVAGECGCSFISVKGPELLDMYVGESEKNVREVFSRAVAAAPCVVFFDELDALAPSRGRGSDSGGVADRVVSQLVAELDGIVARGNVFVIAASNRPDLVDPGLLRPGRLDKMIYVSMPLSRKEQQAVLTAQTRRFELQGEVDFAKVLSFAPPPPTVSGADLYALAANAWMLAAKRLVRQGLGEKEKSQVTSRGDHIATALRKAAEWVEKSDIYMGWSQDVDSEGSSEAREDGDDSKEEDSSTVQVSQEDFVTAAAELQPSLSKEQLREYEELRIRIETGV